MRTYVQHVVDVRVYLHLCQGPEMCSASDGSKLPILGIEIL